MGLTLVIDAKLRDFSVINGKFDGFKVQSHLIQIVDLITIDIYSYLGAGAFARGISRRR